MPSNNHEDKIFKNKKILKNPIKFKVSLNEEQKVAKEIILKNKKGSGFKFIYNCSKRIKNMASVTLKTNHRDPYS